MEETLAIKEALALIKLIIEEHKIILQKVQTLEQVANDASAIKGLDQAEKGFVPGRLNDQRRVLQTWQESVEIVDQGLQDHFDREETRLSTAFDKCGDSMLASALRALLLEHGELRNRLAKARKDVAELTNGGAQREVWEGRAWGARVYITHTRKLIEAHHQSEQKLLLTLRMKLTRAVKGEDNRS